MKQIHFVTSNPGKVRTVQERLSKHGIEVIHFKGDVPEPRTYELRDIAKIKVLAAFKMVGKPVIAQDSGFFIPSWNGFPKTYVNFVLETIGLEGLIKLVDGGPRECEFRNCLAYYDGTLPEPVYFESIVPGAIATEQRGGDKKYAWSKLFKIFIPAGETKTLAEMEEAEYYTWMHGREGDSFATAFAKWFIKQ